MTRFRKVIAWTSGAIVTAVVGYQIASESGVFKTEVWVREAPLSSPLAVASVSHGLLTLEDGRVFRPAGVKRRERVSIEEFDRALGAAAAQGVVISRDLGDGRAVLTVEPCFYNWCGTRGYQGNPFAHWAGTYFQCGLSETMILTRYGDADLMEPGLSAREQWRLEGLQQLRESEGDTEPIQLNPASESLRYEGGTVYGFERYREDRIAVLLKPPPE